MNFVGILSSSTSPCDDDDKEKNMTSDVTTACHIRTDGKYTCSYACNTNSVQQQCLELQNALGETREWNIYQRTGAPIHPAYALGQLRDLYDTLERRQEQEREQHEQSSILQWTSIASICIANWTGKDILSIPISYSEASWTGMLDFRTGSWDEECLSLLPISCRNALPQVVGGGGGGGGQTEENLEPYVEGISQVYQKRWPEFQKTCKFVLGWGDGACATIGSKCTSVNRIAVTIGTSAAARLLLRLPLFKKDKGSSCDNQGQDNLGDGHNASNEVLHEIPMGLFCYRVDRDRVLLGGALTDGGSVIAWLRELLNLKSQQEYNQCQEKAALGYMTCAASAAHENRQVTSLSKALTLLPFLSGERSTGFRVGATGCISGISRCTTSVDLLRECLESVVLRINAILELFQKAVIFDNASSPPTIIASGNALEKSDLWRRMLADCSGMTVVLDEDAHEGTSRGAAIMVAKVLLLLNDSNSNMEVPTTEQLSILHQTIPEELHRHYWLVKKEIQNKLIDIMESTWK